jgi:uncharacterized protein YjbI with pentapeptide repeats
MRPDNEQIIKALRRTKHSGKLPVGKTETGMADLRGIVFPGEIYIIKKFHFDNVDFSGANLERGWFTKCIFTNCLFEKTKMEAVTLEAMQWSNCRFINASLRDSSIGMRIGKNSGSIHNCVFTKTNLSYTSFNFPLITDTIFDHCKIHETNFDSSRFTNCVFKGKLSLCFFCGHSWHWSPGWFRPFSIDYKKFPNPMMNVDFTEAELGDVNFSHGIDLSHCKFSLTENQVLVKNTAEVFSKVRKIIADSWTGKEREINLQMIDEHYRGPSKLDQQMDILEHYPQYGNDRKFFELVKSINDSLPN